jgi:hypothetical protein
LCIAFWGADKGLGAMGVAAESAMGQFCPSDPTPLLGTGPSGPQAI